MDSKIAELDEKRAYRNLIKSFDLVTFEVVYNETDLLVSAKSDLKKLTFELIKNYYREVENYIRKNPLFGKSFFPIEVEDEAPEIVKKMSVAGKIADVGPMAAVAGTIAEFVGRDLLKFTDEVIVENGGDIFMQTLKDRVISIYAGNSEITYKVGIRINRKSSPCGICTSSGVIGHSFSFGKADAAVVVSESAAIADAFATAIGNIVKTEKDIKIAIDFAKTKKSIRGVIIIIEDKIGIYGDIEVVNLHGQSDKRMYSGQYNSNFDSKKNY